MLILTAQIAHGKADNVALTYVKRWVKNGSIPSNSSKERKPEMDSETRQ
jgi:hypothetical protein